MTEKQIKALSAKIPKTYKVQKGLSIRVTHDGAKRWVGRKDGKTLSLGIFPETDLKTASESLASYSPPSPTTSVTLKDVALEYLLKQKIKEQTIKEKRDSLSLHIFPSLGNVPIAHISRMAIIECLESVAESGKVATANKLLNTLNQVFGYTTTRDLVPYNIVRDIDRRFTIGRVETTNHPTLTNETRIAQFVKALNELEDSSAKRATQFALLTAGRVENVRSAHISEFDFEKCTWMLSKDQMKMKKAHTVYLSKQALNLVDGVGFLFPSKRVKNKPIGENAINQTIKILGFGDELVAHGLRAMFSTICHSNMDVHGVSSEVIELCLAHSEKNKVKATYNKSEYTKERIHLMQWWADWLDGV